MKRVVGKRTELAQGSLWSFDLLRLDSAHSSATLPPSLVTSRRVERGGCFVLSRCEAAEFWSVTNCRRNHDKDQLDSQTASFFTVAHFIHLLSSA